jgi:hypothetical protein
MNEMQIKARARRRWWLFPVRLAVLVVLAATVGGVLNHLSASLDRSAQPAGFQRGVLQGALMPMALPNILVGRDVAIYSPNNTGIGYKLGYTVGVNVCGAIFFGLLFLRLSRWRKWTNA